MEKIGWQTKIIDNCQFFLRPMPLFGSIIKIQRSQSIPFVQLDQLAQSNHALLVSAEPASEELVPQLLQHGFRMNKGAMIPSKTRQIDLSPSEQAIFQSFNRTRKYKIGKAQRNNFEVKIVGAKGHALAPDGKSGFQQGVALRSQSRIDEFTTLWTQNALKRGF